MSVKTSPSFLRKSPKWLFIICSAVLIVVAGLWWTQVHSKRLNSDHVFQGMLENSLSTSGVTVSTEQSDGTQTVKQLVQYELGANPQARSLSVFTRDKTEIKTEMLATPKADYTRYASVKTDEKSKDGKPLDFSKIINVWAKSDQEGGKLFSQTLLSGIVPQADLSPEQREKLLTQIRNDRVYDVEKDVTKRKNKENGRLEYVYHVKVQYIPYANLMKNFSKAVGLHDLDDLDPNSFSGAGPMEISVVVDARSRQLVSVEHLGADAQPTQYYSGHGLHVPITVPEKTITTTELESRFDKL